MGLSFIIVTVLGPEGQICGKNIISLKTKIHLSLKQKLSAYLCHDSLSQSYLYSMDSKLKSYEFSQKQINFSSTFVIMHGMKDDQ